MKILLNFPEYSIWGKGDVYSSQSLLRTIKISIVGIVTKTSTWGITDSVHTKNEGVGQQDDLVGQDLCL